ncbi:hypothetical protein GY45DRAFT_58575 [Cubamyces sp. BRFM 1775]|nr:hypothetical protein GY45DRAFT_58575 [Cubamyces sp. BRFM 1775]
MPRRTYVDGGDTAPRGAQPTRLSSAMCASLSSCSRSQRSTWYYTRTSISRSRRRRASAAHTESGSLAGSYGPPGECIEHAVDSLAVPENIRACAAFTIWGDDHAAEWSRDVPASSFCRDAERRRELWVQTLARPESFPRAQYARYSASISFWPDKDTWTYVSSETGPEEFGRSQSYRHREHGIDLHRAPGPGLE